MIASKIYWLKQRITKLISHLTKWHLCQSNVKKEEEKNTNTEIHLKAYNYFVIFFFKFQYSHLMRLMSENKSTET